MEFVTPIKDINKINRIKHLLYKQSRRDYVFFVMGTNTGIRISDLLKIKVLDIYDGNEVLDFYYVDDNLPPYYLNSIVKEAVEDYLASAKLSNNDFLFTTKRDNCPITRQQAYRIINHAAKKVGVPGNIGTHTLRKTFGYHAYKKGIAISLIQEILHHSSKSETLKYLGIDKNEEQVIKIDVNL